MITAVMIAIICIAYFVQAAFGFGAALIALPVMSLFMNAKTALVILAVFSVLTGMLVIPLRRHIDRKKIIKVLPGVIIGLVIGLALFGIVSERALGLIIGGYLLVYVFNDIAKPAALARMARRIPKAYQPSFAGVTSGIVQGVTGTGGPMMVTYLKNNTDSVAAFRATTMFIFLVMNIARCFFMGTADFIRPEVIKTIAITLPFFGIALFLGYHAPKKINDRVFRMGINGLLLASAFSLLVKYVR